MNSWGASEVVEVIWRLELIDQADVDAPPAGLEREIGHASGRIGHGDHAGPRLVGQAQSNAPGPQSASIFGTVLKIGIIGKNEKVGVPLQQQPLLYGKLCEEVRKKVREILRAGADIIKVCSTGGVLSPTDHPEFTQFTLEELEVMVQEAAYRRGVKVMAHAQGLEGIKNAVKAGIHSIEHGIYLDDAVIEMMLAKGTYLVPTLLAPVAVLEQAEAAGMPEYGVRKARESIEAHSESIAKAHKAGVNIAMGTDAGVMKHGTNLRELGLMCNIGMTPMESIVATTKVAAACLGWQDKLGTLEAGKLADIIVAKSDPLADVRSLEDVDNIGFVMKDGKVYKNQLSS